MRSGASSGSSCGVRTSGQAGKKKSESNVVARFEHIQPHAIHADEAVQSDAVRVQHEVLLSAVGVNVVDAPECLRESAICVHEVHRHAVAACRK